MKCGSKLLMSSKLYLMWVVYKKIIRLLLLVVILFYGRMLIQFIYSLNLYICLIAYIVIYFSLLNLQSRRLKKQAKI